MSDNVYIVVGMTGEYDDFREWAVAAFTSKRRAETWKKNCKRYAPRKKQAAGLLWSGRDELHNPYDPDMDVDYTGVSYYVTRARLDPAHPTAAEVRKAAE